MASTKFETSRFQSNKSSNQSATADTRKRRIRLLMILVSLFLFITIIRSNDTRGTSNVQTEATAKLQRPVNKLVSVEDSQKALNQLKKISEDTKSTTTIKTDPVSANRMQKDKKDDIIRTVNSNNTVNRTAIIVTCPACRLNALPSVKKFVYRVAPYFKPQLKIDFIRGMDPVLHLYEDGKEIETLDLHTYTWETITQKLVKFGINPTSDYEPINEVVKKMSIS